MLMYSYSNRLNPSDIIGGIHTKEIGPCVGTSWLSVLVHTGEDIWEQETDWRDPVSMFCCQQFGKLTATIFRLQNSRARKCVHYIQFVPHTHRGSRKCAWTFEWVTTQKHFYVMWWLAGVYKFSRSQIYGNQITATMSGMKWPYVQM
jgi:hypothetical protein